MERLSLILILLSLAENCLLSLLILSLLAIDFKLKDFFKLFISVCLTVLIVRTLPVTSFITLLSSIIVYIIFLKLIFHIPYLKGTISTLLAIVIYLFLESTMIPLVSQVFNTNLKTFLTESSLRTLLFLPQAVLIILVIFLIKRYKFNLSNLFEYLNKEDLELMNDELDLENEKKISSTMYLVILFLIFQGLFIISTNWSKQIFPLFNINTVFQSQLFINLNVVLLTLILFYLIKKLVIMLKMQQNKLIEKIKKKSTERLNWELRMQYHDFNHHLGMINMMLKMNQVEGARKYLKGVVDELEKIETLLNSGSKALNALLYSKIARGEKRGVKINVLIKNPLARLTASDWDLNRIIGNLLDNGIEAVSQLKQERRVEVVIDGSIFEVKSVGVLISSEIEEHIFERGFTSKKEEGHGMGLAICKELVVDRYHGQIFIKRDNETKSTSFIVQMPVGE